MNDAPSWQSLPPDSADRPALLLFFASLVCICVALFGERMVGLYLGIPAACTLVLYTGLRLQRTAGSCTGFTLDDTARELRPDSGRAIPFDAISAVLLILYRDRACLRVRTGALGRSRYLACMSRTAARDILQALSARALKTRVSRNPFTRRTAQLVPLIVMPLLAAILLYVSIDMFRQFPCLALPPQQLSVEHSIDPAGGQLYQLDQVSFSLPETYHLIGRQDHRAAFLSADGAVRMVFDEGRLRPTVPQKPLLQAIAGVLGFGSDHDAALLAIRSRFGLLPGMIKAALLKNYDPDTVRIYGVRTEALNGVMLRGEQARPAAHEADDIPDQVTEILLRDAGKDLVVRIVIVSRLPLDNEPIQRLIAGIH